MSFIISKRVQRHIMELAGQKGWDPEVASLIPDCNGLVLVKYDTQAFHERLDKKGVFMMPFSLTGTQDGKPIEMKFFVCTS